MTPITLAIAPARSVLPRIAPAVLIIFFSYLTVGMPLAALPLQVHDTLGFGSLAVGVVISTQSLATVMTRQLAGSLCDRRGAKLSIMLGCAASVAAGVIYLASTFAALGAAGSFSVLLLGRVMHGLAESLLTTGVLAWAIGTAGAPNTGKVMVWVGIGMYAAIAVGAPLGIHLVTYGGFAAVAIGTVAFALVASALSAVPAPVAIIQGARLSFRKVAGRVAPFGIGLALATLGFGAIGAFAALDFHHHGWSGAGFALTGFGSAYILTRLLFGSWPDRFGGRRVAIASLVMEVLGQSLLLLAPGPSIAVFGAILTGAGISLVFPSFGIEAVSEVPAASRGAALGAYVAFFDIGFILAGPTTGLVAGAFGYPAAFAAGACGAAAAIAVACATRPRPNV